MTCRILGLRATSYEPIMHQLDIEAKLGLFRLPCARSKSNQKRRYVFFSLSVGIFSNFFVLFMQRALFTVNRLIGLDLTAKIILPGYQTADAIQWRKC